MFEFTERDDQFINRIPFQFAFRIMVSRDFLCSAGARVFGFGVVARYRVLGFGVVASIVHWSCLRYEFVIEILCISSLVLLLITV